MANSILEDFYLGAIVPNERKLVKGSEAERLTAEKAEAGRQLHDILDKDAQAVLERFEDAQATLVGIIAEESYIDGFKTGAQFMMEILDDSSGELSPVRDQGGEPCG